jgi:hypothetical protein
MKRVNSKARHSNILWPSIAFVLCVLLGGGFLLLRRLVSNSVYHAEAIQLPQFLDRWVEVGRPEGEALNQFMKGRRTDLVATNRVVRVGETDYATQFSLSTPNSHTGVETFLITTNRLLISIDKKGRAQLAPLRRSL